MTMIKATTAVMKAHFSKYLRSVREGKSILILSRDVPVARLVPVGPPTDAVQISDVEPGAVPLGMAPLPRRRKRPGVDTTKWLRQDRDKR